MGHLPIVWTITLRRETEMVPQYGTKFLITKLFPYVKGYFASKSRGWRCGWEREVERCPSDIARQIFHGRFVIGRYAALTPGLDSAFSTNSSCVSISFFYLLHAPARGLQFFRRRLQGFFMARTLTNMLCFVKLFFPLVRVDDFVKSPPNRHTGESRYPELFEYTGFRVKHGMTKQGKIDFLRGRQG